MASLFVGTADRPGVTSTPGRRLLIAVAITAVCLVLNSFGTRTLALISKIGLAAELIGIILVGLYLLVFERHNSLSMFFDSGGIDHNGSYFGAFMAASLVGLFLYYGFEACGEVAEEVPDPARSIPRAMQLTVVVGGLAAIFAFVGYALAAPDLPSILAGKDANPIPAILQNSIGTVGTKLVLVVTLTSFLAGVMSQQAAASRIVFSFARDDMFPGAHLRHRIVEGVGRRLPGGDAVQGRPVGRARAGGDPDRPRRRRSLGPRLVGLPSSGVHHGRTAGGVPAHSVHRAAPLSIPSEPAAAASSAVAGFRAHKHSRPARTFPGGGGV